MSHWDRQHCYIFYSSGCKITAVVENALGCSHTLTNCVRNATSRLRSVRICISFHKYVNLSCSCNLRGSQAELVCLLEAAKRSRRPSAATNSCRCNMPPIRPLNHSGVVKLRTDTPAATAHLKLLLSQAVMEGCL